jgi:hypothetical protein
LHKSSRSFFAPLSVFGIITSLNPPPQTETESFLTPQERVAKEKQTDEEIQFAMASGGGVWPVPLHDEPIDSASISMAVSPGSVVNGAPSVQSGATSDVETIDHRRASASETTVAPAAAFAVLRPPEAAVIPGVDAEEQLLRDVIEFARGTHSFEDAVKRPFRRCSSCGRLGGLMQRCAGELGMEGRREEEEIFACSFLKSTIQILFSSLHDAQASRMPGALSVCRDLRNRLAEESSENRGGTEERMQPEDHRKEKKEGEHRGID